MLLAKHLQLHGFIVDADADNGDLHQMLLQRATDLVLIDRQWPSTDTLDLCRQLRERGSNLPLLLLLPNDCYGDRVAALQAGADDALSSPFALEELLARLQALLRRSRMGVQQQDGALIQHRDLCVNTNQRTVSRAGEAIKATVKEYDLLLYLLLHRQQVMPRHQILRAVWGDAWVGDDNLLDVYIRYLRKKIERPGLEPLIHTVRGVGFMLQ
jgi:DNA-binding response OmpR family regulator